MTDGQNKPASDADAAAGCGCVCVVALLLGFGVYSCSGRPEPESEHTSAVRRVYADLAKIGTENLRDQQTYTRTYGRTVRPTVGIAAIVQKLRDVNLNGCPSEFAQCYREEYFPAFQETLQIAEAYKAEVPDLGTWSVILLQGRKPNPTAFEKAIFDNDARQARAKANLDAIARTYGYAPK